MLAFDAGVYLVVVGLVMMMFESFGDDPPPFEDDRVVPELARESVSMSVLMAATAATLFGIGTYLLLQRKLSRVIIGLGLISHGANVLFVNSGRRGLPPIIGQGDPADFADPLPQASCSPRS